MDIQPIGVVHSPISDPGEMPFEGVPALIELLPRFEQGLVGITGGSHIQVIGWLHQAGRESLQITQTRWGADGPRGVFGLRSSHRPNPLSLTTCRLLRVEGVNVQVERLDLIDGTPIVDIKRYSPSWDCVFSARSSRDLRFPKEGDRRPVFDGMLVEAANFHGERCPGVALGVRLLHHAMAQWGMAQKDPKLVVRMGDDGCIADALQGLTGATLGNGRMKVPGGRAFRLSYSGEKALAYYPRDLPADVTVERVLEMEIDELFSIRGDVYAEGNGPHGGRPAKAAPAEEKQSILLARIQEAASEGRLACALAHRLAGELGVSVPDVGWAADASRIRITRCQLGCFK
ncbi:MAG: tRNA (N6-threonylcarbamoyladenosine(37)-N6)-methyltransferase TrmO [Chloroflexota bacterium]